MSDNVTIEYLDATQYIELKPDASENIEAWMEHYYTPPKYDGLYLMAIVLPFFFGLVLISIGVHNWLKKKEKTME